MIATLLALLGTTKGGWYFRFHQRILTEWVGSTYARGCGTFPGSHPPPVSYLLTSDLAGAEG